MSQENQPGKLEGKVLRLALVGCGAISEWHRKAIARIPEIQISAVVDIDAGRARAVARDTNAQVFTSLAEALRQERS